MIKKILLLLLLSISTAQAENLRKVEFVRVIDGDTIEVRYTTSIRLLDIECYENHNNERADRLALEYDKTKEEVLTAGKESEQKLKELIKGNEDNLYLQVNKLDKYKRILGKMFIGRGKNKKNINEYMLKSGGCLPYKNLPKLKKNKRGK
jgi:endonuclease YncB( thermonuclease family)